MARLITLDEKIGPGTALVCGVQHVLAMFVGIITPPLIIGGALGLSRADAAFLVSMALFTSGVTTYVQVRRFGGIGSGLLSVQGTSFTFVPLALEAGRAGGISLILGLTMLCAPVEIVLSRFIGLMRKLFPPVVTGSVIMIIGFSLIRVGMFDLAGGVGAEDFGSFKNIAMGFFVMAVILIFNIFGNGFLRIISIALGLVTGYILAALLGWIDFTAVRQAELFTFPTPLYFGLDFNLIYLFPWIVGYAVTSIESIGDLTATSTVSKEPVKGSVYIKRLKGGVLADGLGSIFAGFFNAMPNTTFSQNNGVIKLTGVASRRVGLVVALLLTLLGLFPQIAAVISIMPKSVLGGATIVLFATVAVAGLRLVITDGLTARKEIILTITLALALGTTMVPEAFAGMDSFGGGNAFLQGVFGSVKIVLQSGVAVAGITATALNLVLPKEKIE